MNILVIVDMQAKFPASLHPYTQDQIIKEIQNAKNNNDFIIVLEYACYGPTLSRIMNAIGFYNKLYVLQKDDDDGSPEISSRFFGGSSDENICFRITGVNLNACVADTAIGLANMYKNAKVQIVSEACNGMKIVYGKSNPTFEQINTEKSLKYILHNCPANLEKV
jgi:hypothetical protein